jgi:hypothetical protein
LRTFSVHILVSAFKISLFPTSNDTFPTSLEQLRAAQPLQAAALAHEIVQAAAGVFLSVRLVVASLLRGLRNLDGISDLRSRLDSLPKELRSLYKYMIKTVKPLYQTSSSQLFQLMPAAIAYRVEDWEDLPPLNVLCLSLASDDDGICSSTQKKDF